MGGDVLLFELVALKSQVQTGLANVTIPPNQDLHCGGVGGVFGEMVGWGGMECWSRVGVFWGEVEWVLGWVNVGSSGCWVKWVLGQVGFWSNGYWLGWVSCELMLGRMGCEVVVELGGGCGGCW